MDRGVNVLAFGMPGTGKTHAMCAIGHRLVQAGRSVLFIPAYRLVQDMLAAKRDLDLPRMLSEAGQRTNFAIGHSADFGGGMLPQGAERRVGGAVHSDLEFTNLLVGRSTLSSAISSILVFS